MTVERPEDDPLLAAYRTLLRIAREKKAGRRAAAETPPDEHKEGAAPRTATPTDADLNPNHEVSVCPTPL